MVKKTDSGIITSIFCTAGLHFTTLPVEYVIVVYLFTVTVKIFCVKKHGCLIISVWYHNHWGRT